MTTKNKIAIVACLLILPIGLMHYDKTAGIIGIVGLILIQMA
jgi:hypothetical protein